MPYFPQDPSNVTTVEQLLDYVQEQFGLISATFNETQELELRGRNVEPKRPREGMIVHADGTNWNPGSGAGAYVYSGGAWHSMNNPTPPARGLEYLATLTASNSATLDDTASITAAYDAYMFELVNLVPATNGTSLLMQYQISAAFVTSSYLNLLSGGYKAGFDASGHSSETLTTGIKLSGDGTNFNSLGNTASYGVNGMIWLHSPNSANYKATTGVVTWLSGASTVLNTAAVGGLYNGGTGVVTGARFKMASGNITSGLVKVWGLKTP